MMAFFCLTNLYSVSGTGSCVSGLAAWAPGGEAQHLSEKVLRLQVHLGAFGAEYFVHIHSTA